MRDPFNKTDKRNIYTMPYPIYEQGHTPRIKICLYEDHDADFYIQANKEAGYKIMFDNANQYYYVEVLTHTVTYKKPFH